MALALAPLEGAGGAPAQPQGARGLDHAPDAGNDRSLECGNLRPVTVYANRTKSAFEG